MDELRVNDEVIVDIKSKQTTLEGVCTKIEYDRIFIKISDDFIELAKEVDELDDVLLIAHTHLGIKKMEASVIEGLNKFRKIIIENNPTIEVEQKRKYVRVVCDFDIKIIKDNKKYICKAKNISSGGIAFRAEDKYFNIDDEVEIILPSEIFEKEIKATAKIVKMNDLNYALRYDNLDEYDENKIMKFVFKVIADNKNK